MTPLREMISDALASFRREPPEAAPEGPVLAGVRRELAAIAADVEVFHQAQARAYEAVRAYAIARQTLEEATDRFRDSVLPGDSEERWELIDRLKAEGADLTPLRTWVPGSNYRFADLLGDPIARVPPDGSVGFAVSLDLLVGNTKVISEA